jgi:hypothetical protein
MIEPHELTTFQPTNASGYCGIRRGIPFNPKKCIGKKIMFTDTNNNQ